MWGAVLISACGRQTRPILIIEVDVVAKSVIIEHIFTIHNISKGSLFAIKQRSTKYTKQSKTKHGFSVICILCHANILEKYTVM